MCQYYPESRTCCGIPLRVGLIFIALLAIVTGALLNATIKKVGVNVSSIQDVRELAKSKNSSRVQARPRAQRVAKPRAQRAAPDSDYFENVTGALLNATIKKVGVNVSSIQDVRELGKSKNSSRVQARPRAQRVAKPRAQRAAPDSDYFENVTGALINVTIKKVGVNVSSIQDVRELGKSKNSSRVQARPRAQRAASDSDYFENLRDAPIVPTRRPWPTTGWMLSTVEIIGEDGHTEIISFQDDSDTVNPTEPTTTTMTITTERVWNITAFTTTTIPATTVTTYTSKDKYAELLGKINRNGLNFLSIAFIVLGIVLLIANFMNSPEVAMIWVGLCLVVCVVSLVLLLSVVGECARDMNSCLMRHLDWMSAFLVGLFWFLYIFVWFYFAAVANSLASDVMED